MTPPPLPPPLKSKKERLPSYTIERTKNRFRYRIFALKKKARSTEQNLAFQSRAKACYRQQGVSSSGGLTDAVCCEPHAGSCFSVSGPLQPIPGASLPLLILELLTLFRFLNSLFRSSKKKKTLPLLSLSPLFGSIPRSFHQCSCLDVASFSLTPRKSSSSAPSFDGARWCFYYQEKKIPTRRILPDS